MEIRKTFAVYTLANLMATGIPFLMLPFLTKYLSKSEYGILSNYTGLISFFIPLIGINLASAFSRQYVKKNIDISLYTASSINLVFLITLFFSGILFIFQNYFYSITGVDQVFIATLSIYIFFFVLFELLMTQFRMEDKVWHFAGFRVVRSFLEVALSYFFIAVYNWGYFGRCIGIIGALVLFLIPMFIFFRKYNYLRLKLHAPSLKHFMSFGLPLIPHAIGGVVLAYSDKLIITNVIDLSANGIYSVAYQIGLIIALVQNSFNQAWVPWFYKKLEIITIDIKKNIVRLTYKYFIFLALLCLSLVLFTPIIFSFLDKSFQEGKSVVLWISIGFMFNGLYKMMVNYLFYAEKTKTIALVTICCAALNIGLNLILINTMGLIGTAIATAISLFVQFIATMWLSNKYFPMPWFNFKSA